jgi:hypothetical protein
VNMAGACVIAYEKKQTFGHLRDVVTNRVIAYGKFQTVRHIGDTTCDCISEMPDGLELSPLT